MPCVLSPIRSIACRCLVPTNVGVAAAPWPTRARGVCSKKSLTTWVVVPSCSKASFGMNASIPGLFWSSPCIARRTGGVAIGNNLSTVVERDTLSSLSLVFSSCFVWRRNTSSFDILELNVFATHSELQTSLKVTQWYTQLNKLNAEFQYHHNLPAQTFPSKYIPTMWTRHRFSFHVCRN